MNIYIKDRDGDRRRYTGTSKMLILYLFCVRRKRGKSGENDVELEGCSSFSTCMQYSRSSFLCVLGDKDALLVCSSKQNCRTHTSVTSIVFLTSSLPCLELKLPRSVKKEILSLRHILSHRTCRGGNAACTV